MRDLDAVFDALAKSAFRRRFALGVREGKVLREKGVDTVVAQAHELIGKRLAPQAPLNDGKQTPFRGHPVFIAQHATATCCRSCLAKWHGIAAGKRSTTPSANMSSMPSNAGCARNRCRRRRTSPRPTIRSANCLSDAL
ncbi:DUF4186 family protein [Caballeronia sp. NCTM1]|uniref:DUF4186 family protein n=1 Tax=Caballeronia sp. NCTM1 TaxID=2921753 RepID=UPI0020293226|nr:DUF4186 family protein [Caballeronia sp. NCTM1]